jgi:hypothetical protein
MREADLRWNIDVWLLDFDNEVDALFSAGESERGEAAYRAWHKQVLNSLSDLDAGIGKAFERTGQPRLPRSSAPTTTRAKFMRSCGGPAKSYLLKLRSDLQKSMRSNEFEPKSAAATVK